MDGVRLRSGCRRNRIEREESTKNKIYLGLFLPRLHVVLIMGRWSLQSPGPFNPHDPISPQPHPPQLQHVFNKTFTAPPKKAIATSIRSS